MTTEIQTLKDKIAQMRRGLDNPSITGATKESLEKAIQNAEAKLKDMEAVETSTAKPLKTTPQDAPKDAPPKKAETPKITKTDFYARMDKQFPGQTRNGIQKLEQSDYDEMLEKMRTFAKTLIPAGDVKPWTDAYIMKHLPAGEKTEPKKQGRAKEDAPAPAEAKPVFSWKKKADTDSMKPIELFCQHYSQKVTKDTVVRLKGTGDESIVVTAKPGEYLIFDENGYLVFIMEGESFKKKCNVSSSPAPNKAPEKPAESATPDQKKKKRANCTLEEAETGRRVNNVVNWFLREAMDWRESKSSRQITKVMRVKGTEGQHDIIVEVADYAGVSGIAAFLGGRKYYRVCVDSFDLDKREKPKAGSYTIVVKEADMKRVYTTKGDEMYMACLKTYRELLKCSFEGSCSEGQKKKWKEAYHECGDLVSKIQKRPEAARKFHAEVKSRRKPGESYPVAMARVAEEIRKELAA